jgi:hypothetical protein
MSDSGSEHKAARYFRSSESGEDPDVSGPPPPPRPPVVLTADNWQSIADNCSNVATLFTLKRVCKESKEAVACTTHKFALPNFTCRTEVACQIEAVLGLDARQIRMIDIARGQDSTWRNRRNRLEKVNVVEYIEIALKKVVEGSTVKLDEWKVLSDLMKKAVKDAKKRALAAARVWRGAQVDACIARIAPNAGEVYSLTTLDDAIRTYVSSCHCRTIKKWINAKNAKKRLALPPCVVDSILKMVACYRRIVDLHEAFAKIGCTVPKGINQYPGKYYNYYDEFVKRTDNKFHHRSVKYIWERDLNNVYAFKCGYHQQKTAQHVAACYAHNRYLVLHTSRNKFLSYMHKYFSDALKDACGDGDELTNAQCRDLAYTRLINMEEYSPPPVWPWMR